MNQPQLLDSRYQVVKKLSEGGFGVAYLARDTRRPGKPLCVAKELRHEHHNNPKIIQLFHQEAEMLERLGRHDQIPQLLAAFHEVNRLYLVQEYINGVTVYDELQSPSGEKQRRSEREVVNLLRDVLTALAFVHQHQVVHRDIKPANLIRRKQDGKIMLIDFGAVKALTHSQIQSTGQITTTVSIGSPGYSPHEQISQGNPRPASDIYALGITAIEALTGMHPTELWTDPNTGELVWQGRAQVPPPLAAFLTQMVRHHFSRRFRDAETALRALEAITSTPKTGQAVRTVVSESQPTVAVEKSAVGGDPSDKSRREMLKFLGFSVLGVAATLGGQQLLQGRDGPDNAITSGSASESLQTAEDASVPAETDIAPTPEPTSEPVEIGSTETTLDTINFQTVKVNGQGQVIDNPSSSAQYFDEPYLLGKLGDALPLRMVQIPAGEFMMGSPDSEANRGNDEGPQRRVTVPNFFMGAFAITQRQYLEIMGKHPQNLTDDDADQPVRGVSWEDAVAFCETLNERTAVDYRLPSEAEWEYACRAGTTTPFTFGETLTPEIANYGGHQNGIVTVDAFFANTFGLYNMHGNLQEFCQDNWSSRYKGAPIDGSPMLAENENTGGKAYRGGSGGRPGHQCRSAHRDHMPRKYWSTSVGFRVACVLSPGALS